jgi:hypothetical protein
MVGIWRPGMWKKERSISAFDGVNWGGVIRMLHGSLDALDALDAANHESFRA